MTYQKKNIIRFSLVLAFAVMMTFSMFCGTTLAKTKSGKCGKNGQIKKIIGIFHRNAISKIAFRFSISAGYGKAEHFTKMP